MTDLKLDQTASQNTATQNSDLIRIFNSALIATRAASKKDVTAEILQLVHSPAFEAIMDSIRNLSARRGISESEAAEWLIQTFRKIDSSWLEFVQNEGVKSLKI